MQLNGITVVFVKKGRLRLHRQPLILCYTGLCLTNGSLIYIINEDHTIHVEGSMFKYKTNRYFRLALDTLTNDLFVRCLAAALLTPQTRPKIKVI